ncbi:hypothetical protein BDA96_02G126100 [Sorghum bicolor]|uniref:Pentacotripeptide-repeat region of PRORP domain-containing protein n=1 Tax=Sorghum bicolor TaxID=4558 RepID=A0A921RM37_SORBI|nr:hypothetical protein BDA96_02G126100 [Sorghum bicolor]
MRPLPASVASRLAAVLADPVASRCRPPRPGLRLGLLHADPVLANSLLRLYLRQPVPCPGLARRLFDEMPARTASSYNTLISHSHSPDDVWGIVRRMVADECAPDRFTVSAVLPVCTSARWGRELHCYAVRDGIGLVSMYCRVGHPDSARTVFNRMVRRNVVSWTAMVGGYMENGMFEDAVDCFRAMWLVDAIPPNRIALITVLSAIEALSGLAEAKQVHGFVVRMMMHAEWGLALCKAAVALFDQMLSSGVKPDSIIGLGVLSACCRSGLVLKGLDTYSSMVNDHGVHPTEEMCACMVDLLGRSGHVYRAFDFVKSMSVEPGPSYGNKEIQDLASRSLLRLEQGKPSNLVAVSNLNASSERWNIVEQVRDTINQGSLKKRTGCSWVNPT